jgi:hypothetical protein
MSSMLLAAEGRGYDEINDVLRKIIFLYMYFVPLVYSSSGNVFRI